MNTNRLRNEEPEMEQEIEIPKDPMKKFILIFEDFWVEIEHALNSTNRTASLRKVLDKWMDKACPQDHLRKIRKVLLKCWRDNNKSCAKAICVELMAVSFDMNTDEEHKAGKAFRSILILFEQKIISLTEKCAGSHPARGNEMRQYAANCVAGRNLPTGLLFAAYVWFQGDTEVADALAERFYSMADSH